MASTPVDVDGVYEQRTVRATYALQADLYANIDSHRPDGWVGPLMGTILHRARRREPGDRAEAALRHTPNG